LLDDGLTHTYQRELECILRQHFDGGVKTAASTSTFIRTRPE